MYRYWYNWEISSWKVFESVKKRDYKTSETREAHLDELNDMETMQLVPSVVNSKFEHLGGIAEVKKTICFIERKV